MDYALELKKYETSTLEEIKNALINNKKFEVNEEILQSFISSLRGRTEATKETYYKGAKHFINYCLEHNIEEVTEEDITSYINYLEMNNKPATINMYVTSLKLLYNFLAKKGIKNLGSDLKGEKISRDFKKDPLTKEQAVKLLNSIDRSTAEGKRNYAMLQLLIKRGLRTIELERANVEDFRTYGTKQVLFIQRKGHRQKDDYTKLSPAIVDAIQDYLATRKNIKPSDPLFISYSDRSNGQRLKTRSIREIVKNSLKKVGINSPRITTHSLRHSAVTFCLLNGGTIQEAQHLAGHENITTTLQYAHNIDKYNNDYESKVDNYLEA